MEQQDRPGWNPPPAQDAPLLSAPETVGSPAAPGARRSRIGTGVAVAAIAIGALGIAGTAYAANAANSPSPSAPSGQGYGGYGNRGTAPGTAPNGQAAPNGGTMPGRGDGGHGRGGMGLGMGMGMGIHGSFVTEKQGGGYQTVDAQRGTVTAVSKDSITVKSADGFTATYVVTADTLVNAKRDGIASVKVGDEVGVMGIENAGKTTAVQIVDRTQIKDSRQKWAPPAPNGNGKASPAPSQSGTA
jgi:hypothetical protein